MCKTCPTPRLPNLLPMQALEPATNIMPQGSTTISIPTDNENRRRRNANRRRRSANWRQWEVTWQILGLDVVMQAALLSAFLSGIEDRINCRIWWIPTTLSAVFSFVALISLLSLLKGHLHRVGRYQHQS